MIKPENPYIPETLIYRLMDEDWSQMTKNEIVEATGSTYKAITSAMCRIKDETGYVVPYIDGRKARWDKLKTSR